MHLHQSVKIILLSPYLVSEQEPSESRDGHPYQFSIDSFNFQELSIPIRQETEPVLVSRALPTIDLEDLEDADDDEEEEVHQTMNNPCRVLRFSDSSQSEESGDNVVESTAEAPPLPEEPAAEEPQPTEPPSQPETQTTAPSSTDVPMGETSGTGSGNADEIPEGVDPSFLEALPPDMRSEVFIC